MTFKVIPLPQFTPTPLCCVALRNKVEILHLIGPDRVFSLSTLQISSPNHNITRQSSFPNLWRHIISRGNFSLTDIHAGLIRKILLLYKSYYEENWQKQKISHTNHYTSPTKDNIGISHSSTHIEWSLKKKIKNEISKVEVWKKENFQSQKMFVKFLCVQRDHGVSNSSGINALNDPW